MHLYGEPISDFLMCQYIFIYFFGIISGTFMWYTVLFRIVWPVPCPQPCGFGRIWSLSPFPTLATGTIPWSFARSTKLISQVGHSWNRWPCPWYPCRMASPKILATLSPVLPHQCPSNLMVKTILQVIILDVTPLSWHRKWSHWSSNIARSTFSSTWAISYTNFVGICIVRTLLIQNKLL